MAFSIIGALGVKERVQPISDKKYTIRQLFPILGMSPVLITFLATLCFGIGSGVMSGSSTFFATYVLGDLALLAGAAGMTILGILPSMILAPLLANKIGKRAVYGGGQCISGLSILVHLVSVTSVPLLYVSYALVGVGTSVMMTVMYGIQADNVDYVEMKKNIRAEGAIASLSSFITKAASGIGGALPAFILAMTGFVRNQEQTTTALNGITFSAITLPAILSIAAGVLFIFFYPIGKKHLVEIESTLRSRREEKVF